VDNTDSGINLPLISAIVGVATIGGFMFGYDSGVINGTQDGLRSTFNLRAAGLGITVSALLPGCALGAFGAGRLADVWGRRKVLLIAATLFILSAMAAGAAESAVVLIVARFLAGAGVGAASVLSPAYISEVTPARLRGRLSSVQQVMIIAGLTGAFLANYFLAHSAGKSTDAFWFGFAAWRWMFWMQLIPATLFLVTLLLIPESPRFLVARGQTDQARAVLTRLLGAAAAEITVRDIRSSIAADHAPSFTDLRDRSTGRLRQIVWVGVGLATFQQLVGINVVFYYGAVLWQAVGFSEADSLKINVLSGSLSVAACLVAMLLIDQIGRKHGHAGPRQRESLCRAVQCQLGTGDVGHAGRDVSESDARLGARRQRCRPMDREFPHQRQFPGAGQGSGAAHDLRLLCELCLYLDLLCREDGA